MDSFNYSSPSRNSVLLLVLESPYNIITDNMAELIKKYIEFRGWHFKIKPEQQDIICHLLEGHNTVGVLPTGYGKSLTYLLPPLLLDEVA